MKKIEDFTREEMIEIFAKLTAHFATDYISSSNFAYEKRDNQDFLNAMMMHMDVMSSAVEPMDEIGIALAEDYKTVVEAMKISRGRFEDTYKKGKERLDK
jgi:hypothetical protein